MSEDDIVDDEFDALDEDLESIDAEFEEEDTESDELNNDGSEVEDEFEEITSEEVDRVVAALETLIETVESENIKSHLDEALGEIYYLIYDQDDEEEGEQNETDDPGLLSEAA